jgi:hypothetical protein
MDRCGCALPNCRRAEEAAAAAEIARVEEAALEVGHKFSSLAEEAAEKTKKLKKLWKKYQVGLLYHLYSLLRRWPRTTEQCACT